MLFQKNEMQDLLFNFIFTASKISNVVLDPRAEGVIRYYKSKQLLSELQLEGSCVGHGEALQGGLLHLAEVLLHTGRVLLGRAEEHGLGLSHACELASQDLLGCLVVACESFFSVGGRNLASLEHSVVNK